MGVRSAPRANGAGTAPVSGTMIILESLNQSSSAEQRVFSPAVRFKSGKYSAAVAGISRLTDAAYPLRVHTVFLRF